jgi:type I restriction enzyme S subunit
LPLPPVDDRKKIAKYLNWKSEKIKRLIKQKKQLIDLFVERRKRATYEVIWEKETNYLRIEVVSEKIQRPIPRLDDELYTPIGLFNRGRGIFHKPKTKGLDLGDSSFYWVRAGDLILSGQFAWEGAVALAYPADDGCIASHRYPILKCDQNILEAGFLYSYLTTKEGHLLLNYNSRGAAGRNRPLNTRTFLKEKIPIPPIDKQKEIVELVEQEIRLRLDVKKEETLLQEYRNRLVSDVVTGKIDVRSIKIPEYEPVEDGLEPIEDDELEEELNMENIEE